MASGKEYLHFILEQLSDLDDISYRPMMGEFILYYRGKIVGGIYDDRLLVKKTRSALELTSFGKVKRKQQKSSIHAGLRRDGSRSDSSLSDGQGAETTIA